MLTFNLAEAAQRTICRVAYAQGATEDEATTRAAAHAADALAYLEAQLNTRRAEWLARMTPDPEASEGGSQAGPIELQMRRASAQATHDLEVYVVAQGW